MIKEIRKKKYCGNNGVDKISELPDDIIVSILSLLPLKNATATCILSTRWSDLWRHTPNLNFHDDINVEGSKYMDCVNSVLESHKALSLKEFSIRFKPADDKSATVIAKWLEFAFSRGVEVLKLDFLHGKNEARNNFLVLEDVLRQSTITTNLKSLFLSRMEVGGEALKLFLRNNCPLLEQLIIKDAVLTSDVEVRCGVLKHLDIQHCKWNGGKLIRVCAPHLTSLTIDDSLKIAYIEENFRKQIELKISSKKVESD